MKIDRLIGIVMYLLNRDLVSARTLAEEFEVSVRTIQRDINSLNRAGIPIMSIRGSSGGYGILDNYKLDKQILNVDDFFFIITALNSLASAYENNKIKKSLEKINALLSERDNSKLKGKKHSIALDLGVLRESEKIDKNLNIIEKAINEEKVITFEYTSNNYNKTIRKVEPLRIIFKWYAWYLFAYCHLREDYRLFRISRIRELKITGKRYSLSSHEIDQEIEEYEMKDSRNYITVKLLCKPEIRVFAEEYFANGEFEERDDESLIVEVNLPEDERFWLGNILSFGDKIKVLEPPQIQDIILRKIREIEKLYNE